MNTNTMDMDDEDDFYSPDEPVTGAGEVKSEEQAQNATAGVPTSTTAEELEEGEEEDEGGAMEEDSDSDVDFIIDAEDDSSKAAPAQPARYADIKNIPERTTTGETTTNAPVKKEEKKEAHLPVPSADKASAAASSSKLDLDGNPVYPPAAKPIMQVNIDTDLPDNEKPWRKPGTDLSDYFNYGFDEFTWALYAARQDQLRQEYNTDSIAASSKKMMEDFNNMMMMGGMPGMPGGPGGAGGGPGAMPGIEAMTPDMQQMMQQMMQAGMDPSQMDPAMFQAMQQAAGGGVQPGGGQGGQGGQNFPQGPGAGFGGGQQGDFGYGQGMGGGGGRGGFGGRGRGRRNW